MFNGSLKEPCKQVDKLLIIVRIIELLLIVTIRFINRMFELWGIIGGYITKCNIVLCNRFLKEPYYYLILKPYLI
jgi:hypothetical protein